MDTHPFELPADDAQLAELRAALTIDTELAALLGGDRGVVRGSLFLTRTLIAFRPALTQDPPQQLTVPWTAVSGWSRAQDHWFGLVTSGRPAFLFHVRIDGAKYDLRFDVDDPQGLGTLVSMVFEGG